MLILLGLLYITDQATSACWETNQRNHRPSIPKPRQMWYLTECLEHKADFQALLDPFLRTRTPESEGLSAVREHIVTQLSHLGWTVELDSFQSDTPLGRKTFTNIVTTLHTDSPRRLILAAHYDSKVSPPGFVGATDSAVPCAMMLHLAASMSSLLTGPTDQVPELTLQLIFFDGEEALVAWTASDSLYGSRHMATGWAAQSYTVRPGLGYCQDSQATQLDRIDSLVVLDLLGTTNPRFERFTMYNTTIYSLASQIEKKLSGRLFLQGGMFTDTDRVWMVEDDQKPFYDQGLRRILHMISTPFPSVWHTVQDDRSALDTQTIQDLNKFLRVFVFTFLDL